MSITETVSNTSRVVHSLYRILVTSILGFYLIKHVYRSEVRRDDD